MSNERQHPDSTVETDEVVSATYRELSKEGAPNYLNEKVLQQAAAKAARPRYSRSIMWTRPLAWAATVGLCLAIVLEVTRIPMPEVVVTEEVVTQEAADSLEAELSSSQAAEPTQVQTPQQPAGVRIEKKSQPGRAATKQIADEPNRELRMRDFAYEAAEEISSVEEGVVSGKVEFEVQDADRLQRSKEVPVSALSASRAVNECSDEVRADPVNWLACIAVLEETGDTEAALRQREALKEAFPEFEMP